MAFNYSISSIRSFERGDMEEAERCSKKAFRCNLIWTISFVICIAMFVGLVIGLSVGLPMKHDNTTTTAATTSIKQG